MTALEAVSCGVLYLSPGVASMRERAFAAAEEQDFILSSLFTRCVLSLLFSPTIS